jgi:hypothetical protein
MGGLLEADGKDGEGLRPVDREWGVSPMAGISGPWASCRPVRSARVSAAP